MPTGVYQRTEEKAFYNLQYIIRKKEAEGTHTVIEWETLLAQYNWTCPCCGLRESDVVLTEDHIIPLSKGGSNNIENIQPLCRSCNSRKRTKTIKFDPKPIKIGAEVKTMEV
jgi:5-methylcytosine-specific restriction endonuclease McrA